MWHVSRNGFLMNGFGRRCKQWLRSRCRRLLGIPVDGLDVFRDLSRLTDLRAAWLSAEFVEERMPSARPLDTKFAVLDYALGVMGKVPAAESGLCCEFGVYKGETLNYIAKRVKGPVYGFDSFEGLPEAWRAGFPQGAFGLGVAHLPACEQNATLVPGWFNESLPPFVASHPQPVAFLHVDCDLYSSTRTIFEHLGSRLMPGAVIVFDEYFNYPGWRAHEYRAFEEFLQESGRRCEYLCYNKLHEQVAVQIW